MFANSLYASLFTAIGIAFGFVIAELVADPVPARPTLVVRTDAPPPAAEFAAQPANDAIGDQIAALRRDLQRERAARENLAEQVAALTRQMAGAVPAPRIAPPEDAGGEELAEAGEAPTDGQRWFDRQALIDGGMPSEQADELRRFFEQVELERLQLRDRAEREDWERGRLREALRELEGRETALRETYGEAAYDAYLYASGKFNRVEISGVLGSAPAGEAGIRGGDQLLRYDNQRIYNPRDLRDAIAEGDLGDPVEIEVFRDDEVLRFYVARGPLGVRLNPLRVPPEEK